MRPERKTKEENEMVGNMVAASRDGLFKLSFTGVQPVRTASILPELEEARTEEEEQPHAKAKSPTTTSNKLNMYIHPSILPQYFRTPRYYFRTEPEQETKEEHAPLSRRKTLDLFRLDNVEFSERQRPVISGETSPARPEEQPSLTRKFFNLLNGLLQYARNEYNQMREFDFTQNPQELRERVSLLQEMKNLVLGCSTQRNRDTYETCDTMSRGSWSTLEEFSLNSPYMTPGSLLSVVA
jgi:hypothetical protein